MMPKLRDDSLKILVGRELSSVEFVRDYIQLRFDGPCLTLVTNPVLEILNDEYTRTTPGFCDALCNFIGYRVEEAILNEEIAILRIENDRKIKISLKSSDRKAEEAIIFDSGNGKWWSW
jgi:hypothetical protein